VQRKWYQAIPVIALYAVSAPAHAGLGTQIELDFAETGFTTAYSAVAAGTTTQINESFGGYSLLVSLDDDNIYGSSDLGTNPYISMTIQVTNVGAHPPANPVTVGMSISGLTAQPGNDISFQSSFTSIFHSSATAGFQTNYDTTDALFGQTNGLSSANGLSSISTSFDQLVTDALSTPYSMSMFVTFYPVAYAHPTLDGELDVASVPEPASAAILGVGIAGLGLRRRQRNRALRSA
jgi:hypothetical protein